MRIGFPTFASDCLLGSGDASFIWFLDCSPAELGRWHVKESSFPLGIWEVGGFLFKFFWLVGCIFGGFFKEQTVEKYIPLINQMFVYGSFSLLLETVYKVFLCVQNKFNMLEKCGKRGTYGTYWIMDTQFQKDANTLESSELPSQRKIQFNNWNWDWCNKLSTMLFFCLAGILGDSLIGNALFGFCMHIIQVKS